MAFIFYLTHIHLGYDALGMLSHECVRTGMKRPLVITDKGVAAAGLAARVLESAKLGALPVFDETPSNPTEAMVLKAADMYRSEA
jgi:alcohol dehydrogenase class IV